MTPHMLRARRSARYLMIAALCAAGAAACGSAAAPGASSGSTTPKVSLAITVSGGNGAPSKHWTLRCDPVGGTHPDPAEACATLFKAKAPFAPAPKGIACPMIMVGAKTAVVKGTYFGQHIDTTFTEGGCNVARWAKIGQIFN
jgi:hypothetical protein